MIETDHPMISIRRQCQLIGLPRSSYYYEAVPESELNLKLMKAIDQLYLCYPFYGYRTMTTHLRRDGWPVNHKRVQRLMVKMGIMAIYPRPNTSVAHPTHKVYPYLLRDLAIEQPNQVWCADITYIPMQQGFMYLMAVMDWFSRYILAWELSNSLDTYFCLVALEAALSMATPDIFNTDQGVQFTSNDFTGRLTRDGIRISMDGRGRAFDNIFIERFWRTLKYQDIYIHNYATGMELADGLQRFMHIYNHIRPHQGLDGLTPAEVYGRQTTPPMASMLHQGQPKLRQCPADPDGQLLCLPINETNVSS